MKVEHKKILSIIHLISQPSCSKDVGTLTPLIDCSSSEEIDNDSDESDLEVAGRCASNCLNCIF